VSTGGELSDCVDTVPRRATHSRAVGRRRVPYAVSRLLRHCADSSPSPRICRQCCVTTKRNRNTRLECWRRRRIDVRPTVLASTGHAYPQGTRSLPRHAARLVSLGRSWWCHNGNLLLRRIWLENAYLRLRSWFFGVLGFDPLALTYGLDFQSLANYGHDPCTCKDWGQMPVGSKDRADTTDFIIFPTDAVGKCRGHG